MSAAVGTVRRVTNLAPGIGSLAGLAGQVATGPATRRYPRELVLY